MQDKFAIGPVTFVQLVGLEAKARIPSAKADGAVRAADHPPTSAAAGLGGKAQQPVADIESTYFSIKAPASLGLSADPLRAHSSLESGVDRAVPEASPVVPKFDVPTVDKADPNTPPTNSRADLPLGEPGSHNGDVIPVISKPDSSSTPVVFDGEKAFGDDVVIDFSATPDATMPDISNAVLEMPDMAIVTGLDADIGESGGSVIVIYNSYHEPLPLTHPSTTDAIPVI